jgi:hypothetical protein
LPWTTREPLFWLRKDILACPAGSMKGFTFASEGEHPPAAQN